MAETGEEQIEELVSLKDAFAKDREEYENDIGEVRKKLAAVIEKWWGPKCKTPPDIHDEAMVTAWNVWAAFNVMSTAFVAFFPNPFEADTPEETELD